MGLTQVDTRASTKKEFSSTDMLRIGTHLLFSMTIEEDRSSLGKPVPKQVGSLGSYGNN